MSVQFRINDLNAFEVRKRATLTVGSIFLSEKRICMRSEINGIAWHTILAGESVGISVDFGMGSADVLGLKDGYRLRVRPLLETTGDIVTGDLVLLNEGAALCGNHNKDGLHFERGRVALLLGSGIARLHDSNPILHCTHWAIDWLDEHGESALSIVCSAD